MMTHAAAVATVPLLAVIAVLVTMACRYYRVGPPASLEKVGSEPTFPRQCGSAREPLLTRASARRLNLA
ncbi:MAG: hypothetical protein RL684_1422 [Pseudomonadota bacterium]|jgi:hypothetical protein